MNEVRFDWRQDHLQRTLHPGSDAVYLLTQQMLLKKRRDFIKKIAPETFKNCRETSPDSLSLYLKNHWPSGEHHLFEDALAFFAFLDQSAQTSDLVDSIERESLALKVGQKRFVLKWIKTPHKKRMRGRLLIGLRSRLWLI